MAIDTKLIDKGLIALITAGILIVAYIFIPFGGSDEFVTFDSHKFLNSQRVMANNMLGKNTNEAEILMMHQQVSEQVESVISHLAGGAYVMSKQAFVVNGAVPDITDAVLNKLGLPTDVSDHNAILINSIDQVEKRWGDWKPKLDSLDSDSPKSPISSSVRDMVP